MISRSTLERFVSSLAGHKAQSAVKTALDAWFQEVRRAEWKNAVEVKRSYATASILSAHRVVFNIKGNDFRLITAVDYRRRAVYVKWIGSHAEYDSIDAKTVKYDDDD